MPILMDQVLAEYADQAYETAQLRRNGVHNARDLIFSEMLAQFEASGDAMRFVNRKGQIAWKATPKLRQYLKDAGLDAHEDLGDI